MLLLISLRTPLSLFGISGICTIDFAGFSYVTFVDGGFIVGLHSVKSLLYHVCNDTFGIFMFVLYSLFSKY